MDSATILMNLTGIPLGQVDVSDLLKQFQYTQDLAVEHFSEFEISRAIIT